MAWFQSIRASDSFSTSLWEIVSDSTVSVSLFWCCWVLTEIGLITLGYLSVEELYFIPLVFLYRVCMHVLYNDFLKILIIGLNVASHHKQCGSGWLFFFFFINVIGNAIGHWSWQFRWAPAMNQGGLVLDVKLFGHCVWFTGLSLVRYFSFR